MKTQSVGEHEDKESFSFFSFSFFFQKSGEFHSDHTNHSSSNIALKISMEGFVVVSTSLLSLLSLLSCTVVFCAAGGGMPKLAAKSVQHNTMMSMVWRGV